MREILFKAKYKDDGKWYEGYYLLLHDTTYCCMPSDNEAEAKRLNEENTHHYIVFEQMTDWELPNRHLRAEILPETLCQYTGLTDKNGKKIWENDICIIHSSCLDEEDGFFTVEWDGNGARFALYGDGLTVDFDNYYGYECEVIGNIFDNPELLGSDSVDAN